MKKLHFNVYVPIQSGSRAEIEFWLQQAVRPIEAEVIFVETFDPNETGLQPPPKQK
jgi:hypothetical protein